jgi:hypothetical protein
MNTCVYVYVYIQRDQRLSLGNDRIPRSSHGRECACDLLCIPQRIVQSLHTFECDRELCGLLGRVVFFIHEIKLYMR